VLEIIERKRFEKGGRSLLNFDKARNHELTCYLILLENQIFLKNREKYYQVLDLFTRKIIIIDEFFNQFYGLRRSNLKTSRM